MSGTHTEVKIDISKTDLFDDIKKTKTVFDEQNNAIHVTENGEVFSITYKGENVYEFSCNYIRMNKGKDRLVPFPAYMMEKFSQDYEYDKPYDVNCDFSYLKEFYELYKGAVVEENSIEFSGKTIQMQDGKVTITQGK